MTVFHFSILTPSGLIISGDVTQVQAISYEGSLGVMAHHLPMVVACPAGKVRLQQEGIWVNFKCEDYLLVTDGGKTTILTAYAQYVAEEL